jgi:hypothetical protein
VSGEGRAGGHTCIPTLPSIFANRGSCLSGSNSGSQGRLISVRNAERRSMVCATAVMARSRSPAPMAAIATPGKL